MLQSEPNFEVLDNLPATAALTGRPLKLAEQEFFLSAGYIQLDHLWTAGFADSMANEARGRRRFAAFPEKGPHTSVDGVRILQNSTLSATGPLLTALHFLLVGFVRALSGQLLVPAFSAYGYYDTDDKTLLHLDQEQCTITLLTVAFGALGPLHLHPEMRGMTMAELGVLEGDATWDHGSGLPVFYPERGMMAITGNTLPHNRPGTLIPEPSAVAALCYRPLF